MTFLWCEQALYKKLRDINVKVRGVLNLSAPCVASSTPAR